MEMMFCTIKDIIKCENAKKMKDGIIFHNNIEKHVRDNYSLLIDSLTPFPIKKRKKNKKNPLPCIFMQMNIGFMRGTKICVLPFTKIEGNVNSQIHVI